MCMRETKAIICKAPRLENLNFVFGFWFLVCNAPTQLATQLHQRHIQVVRSNKVAQKRPTESNGIPAMGLAASDL